MALRGSAALGVCGVAVTLALSACGGSSGSSTTSGGHPAAASGGSLSVASSVAPPTMDLTSNPAAAIDEVLDYNVYQHLVQLAPNGDLVPVLATGWKISPDGLTYTFTLRQGVKFANGDPLTASDVVFSIKRVTAPNSQYPYAALFAGITGATAQGATTVVVTLSKPDNQLLYNMAANSDGVILDPASVATLATATNGTGPYKLSAFVPNYSVTLAANQLYWGGKPALSQITFRYFANANAEIAAMKSGQVQVIDTLSNPQDASQFANSADKLISGPTNGKIQMTINNNAGPLAKLQVRQAIEYATDRPAILRTAGAGYGTVIGSDTVPGDPWYEPGLAGTYPYNPAKAKQLLSQAGYPNGFSTVLTLPPYGYAETAGPLIAAELTQVGIRTTVKNIQWPLWLSQVFANHSFDLTIVDHVEPRDIGNYANCKYYWDFAGCNQVAAILSRAQASTSRAGMVSGYQQILSMITAQAVNDWLYNPDQITVAAKNVVGLPGSGLTESFDLQYASLGGSLSTQAANEGFKA